MKHTRKGYEILDEVITPKNVMRMSELLALRAIKSMCRNHDLHRLYANFARDLSNKNIEGYVLTDSYDMAQNAATFLCEHMGELLQDKCLNEKNGKECTIELMCYRKLQHEMYLIWKAKRNTEYMEGLSRHRQPYVNFEEENTSDYTKYDQIMEKLNLTKEEKETIDYYMQRIGYVRQARLLSLSFSAIRYRRKRAQRKYLAIKDEL